MSRDAVEAQLEFHSQHATYINYSGGVWKEGRGRGNGQANLCHVRPLASPRIEIPRTFLADRAHGRVSSTDALWFRVCLDAPRGTRQFGSESRDAVSLEPDGRVLSRSAYVRPSSAGRSCTLICLGFRCERSLKRAQARGAPNTLECRVHGSRERASDCYRGPSPPPSGRLRLRQPMTTSCEAHGEEDREKRRRGGGGRSRERTRWRNTKIDAGRRVTYGRVISPDIPTADVRAGRGARGKLTT